MGADTGSELQSLEQSLLELLRPANLQPSDPANAFLSVEATFERVCIELELKGVADPGALSLYQFYARVQHLSQKAKSPA